MDSLEAVEGVQVEGLLTIRVSHVRAEGQSALRVQAFSPSRTSVVERIWSLEMGIPSPSQLEDIVAFADDQVYAVILTKVGVHERLLAE